MQELITSGCVDELTKTPTLHCIPVLIQNVLFWLLALAGIAAVILIVFAGLKFILSGGDSKQVEGARKTMTYAVAGLVLILLSYGIISFIAYITGVSCIKGPFNFDNCETQTIKQNIRTDGIPCDSTREDCVGAP